VRCGQRLGTASLCRLDESISFQGFVAKILEAGTAR
jgi:hypothetical protein